MEEFVFTIVLLELEMVNTVFHFLFFSLLTAVLYIQLDEGCLALKIWISSTGLTHFFTLMFLQFSQSTQPSTHRLSFCKTLQFHFFNEKETITFPFYRWHLHINTFAWGKHSPTVTHLSEAWHFQHPVYEMFPISKCWKHDNMFSMRHSDTSVRCSTAVEVWSTG